MTTQGHFPTPATPSASPPVYLSHFIPESMTSEEPTSIKAEKAASQLGEIQFEILVKAENVVTDAENESNFQTEPEIDNKMAVDNTENIKGQTAHALHTTDTKDAALDLAEFTVGRTELFESQATAEETFATQTAHDVTSLTVASDSTTISGSISTAPSKPQKRQKKKKSNVAKDDQTAFPVEESSPSTGAAPQKRQKRQRQTSAVGVAGEAEEQEDVKPKKKRVCRSTKKDIKLESDVDDQSREQVIEPQKKKIRRSSAKKKNAKVNNQAAETTNHDATADATDATVVAAMFDTRSSAEKVPFEIWLRIFDYMEAPSQVSRLSMVSKNLLDFCRSWPKWKTICEVSGIGVPKRKYKTHLALVCSESYYICDKCYSRSTGTGRCRLSEIPCPVIRTDDHLKTWRLCNQCRIEYYVDHPETSRLDAIDESAEISESSIAYNLKLNYYDLGSLSRRCVGRRNLNFHNPDQFYYNKRDATALAMEMFGGWVGVQAAKNRTASRIMNVYRRRKSQGSTSSSLRS
ncbi:hypothetical protein BGZ83_005895 [Gryganskiella cystojenkinii]|nr:hypothetical protein BGZ83_005895 [Gryganskiella cystojenkinii]